MPYVVVAHPVCYRSVFHALSGTTGVDEAFWKANRASQPFGFLELSVWKKEDDKKGDKFKSCSRKRN